jgi:hypothetical protein
MALLLFMLEDSRSNSGLLQRGELLTIERSGIIRGVAQPGSATALGAVGREFESLHPDHFGNQFNENSAAPVAQPDRAPAF